MEKYVIGTELAEKLEASVPALIEIFTPPFKASEATNLVEKFIEPLVKEFAPAATAEEYYEMEMAIWRWYKERLDIVTLVDKAIDFEEILGKSVLERAAAWAIEGVDGGLFNKFVEGFLIPQSAVYLAKYVH